VGRKGEKLGKAGKKMGKIKEMVFNNTKLILLQELKNVTL
jgi:hypothetical protein